MSAKHNQIANHLIADILEGSYRVGERLPSERDLAARFKANRGAVREAMKTLQQIGLADIQPGGARVQERNQASLDVIGHILNRGDLPDREVVDQILVVINNLLALAAEQAIKVATDAELEAICQATRPFYQQQLGLIEHGLSFASTCCKPLCKQARIYRCNSSPSRCSSSSLPTWSLSLTMCKSTTQPMRNMQKSSTTRCRLATRRGARNH